MSDTAEVPTAGVSRLAGLALVVGGILLLAWPQASALVLVTLFGLGAVVHGISELARVFAGEGEHLEVWAGLIGLVSIFGGVVVFLTPRVSAVAAGVVIGVYWLAAGVAEVIGGLVRPGGRLGRLIVGGLSIVAGVVVLAVPTLSLLVLVWLSGLWLVVVGLVILAFAGPRPRAARLGMP